MQIQNVNNKTEYKNNYSHNKNRINYYHSENINQPSFKEGEEILIPVMLLGFFFWGSRLVLRRTMRIFNINGNANDNKP